MGKCYKCKAETSNTGYYFQCTFHVNPNSSFPGAAGQTLTNSSAWVQCVLCDKCIEKYYNDVKKAKVSLFQPILVIVLSSLFGALITAFGIHDESIMSLFGVIFILGGWYFSVKEIISLKKDARLYAKQVQSQKATLQKDDMEHDAEREILRLNYAAVSGGLKVQPKAVPTTCQHQWEHIEHINSTTDKFRCKLCGRVEYTHDNT